MEVFNLFLNREIKGATDCSKPVTEDIITAISNYISDDSKETKRQLYSSILPHVSNALYYRELEIKENEWMKTLIILSRTLDDANLEKAIDALNFKVMKK